MATKPVSTSEIESSTDFSVKNSTILDRLEIIYLINYNGQQPILQFLA
jgi:hypothetical protein